MVDPDEPSQKYLEIFEAQASAAIRENFDCSSIDLCTASNGLLLKFLTVPGTRDKDVLEKIIKNLVNSLNTKSNTHIDKDGYTDLRATELYMSRLQLLAKTILKGPEFVKELVFE